MVKIFLRNKHEIAFFEIKCIFFDRKENTIRGNHSNDIVYRTSRHGFMYGIFYDDFEIDV